MRSRQQERAAFALAEIERVFNGEVKKEAANFIVGSPTMILTSGLGQAMAFMLSKKTKDDKHRIVFDAVRSWLGLAMPDFAGLGDREFLKKLSAVDQRTYLRAQEESLKILEWLKRYARAFEKQGGDND